jgi:hypothetical protein
MHDFLDLTKNGAFPDRDPICMSQNENGSAQMVRKNRQSRKYVQDAGDRTIFRLKFLILYCIHSLHWRDVINQKGDYEYAGQKVRFLVRDVGDHGRNDMRGFRSGF